MFGVIRLALFTLRDPGLRRDDERNVFKRPGNDLLFHDLSRSTIGAASFHGRVRNGIGCCIRAIITRSSKNMLFRLFYSLFTGSLDPRIRGDDRFANADNDLVTVHEYQFKPIEQLVSVSFTRYRASTPDLSTSWSTTALIGNSSFEVGFTLRCFQRLSRPYIATRRCRWRDNRYTRGTSTPVLSY